MIQMIKDDPSTDNLNYFILATTDLANGIFLPPQPYGIFKPLYLLNSSTMVF